MPRYVRSGFIDLSVDQEQLLSLQRALRAAGEKGLQRELQKGLKDAVKPMVPALKSAAMSIPATSGKHNGLRAAMASAITVRYSSSARNPGVRVHIPKRKMPDEWRNMPAYTNREKGWRHPVFGDTETWVVQKGKPGWWYFTARYFGRLALEDIHAAVDRVARQIARGG